MVGKKILIKKYFFVLKIYNMIQIILGEYLKNKVKLIILSNKNYPETNLYSNGKIIKKIQIKEYLVNTYELENIELNNYYFFELEYLDKIIDTFTINLKSNPFNNVLIVNCDSTYGYETGTWDLIKETNSKYVFHLGDQIYNDMIFQKNFNKLKNKKLSEINKSDKKKIFIECYNYFLEQFTRNNKSKILKNNFNLMIPDDHEVIDNSFIDRIPKTQISIYNIIFNIINKLSNSIELSLKFSQDNLIFIKDQTNSSIYILNYTLNIDEDFYSSYKLVDKIMNYSNVIFLQRKVLNSIKNGLVSQYIYKSNKFDYVNIDWILKLGKKYLEKKFFILCGDDHLKATAQYFSNNKLILTIKSVGPINSSVDTLGYDIVLNTLIPDISIKSSKELSNGYIEIFYKNDNICIEDIINKKSYLYQIANSVKSGLKFISFKYK